MFPLKFISNLCLNKKIKGFTLAELLIALTVVGVTATMTVPVLEKATMTGDEKLHQKASQQIEQIVAEMYDDNNLYKNKNEGFRNTDTATDKEISFSGNDKFCKIFASKFEEVDVSSVKCHNPSVLENGQINNLEPSFVSSDGISWYLPSSNFSDGNSVIYIDVNGKSSGSNCELDSSDKNYPNNKYCASTKNIADRMKYYVNDNGTIGLTNVKKEANNAYDIVVKIITKKKDGSIDEVSSGGSVTITEGNIGSEKGKAGTGTKPVFKNLKKDTAYTLRAIPKNNYYSTWQNNEKRIVTNKNTTNLTLIFYEYATYNINFKINGCESGELNKCLEQQACTYNNTKVKNSDINGTLLTLKDNRSGKYDIYLKIKNGSEYLFANNSSEYRFTLNVGTQDKTVNINLHKDPNFDKYRCSVNQEYSATEHKCACKNGYSGNPCVCPNNKVESNGYCCKPIQCCDLYNKDCLCMRCSGSYFPSADNSVCCSNKVKVNYSTGYNSSCKPLGCTSGMVLNEKNNKCCIDNVQNCSTYDNNCQCKSCNDSKLVLNDIKSACCNKEYIKNCTAYKNTSKNPCTCSSCATGYKLQDGKCIECNVAKCLGYSSGCTCNSCETGYKTDKGICKGCGIAKCLGYSSGCTCNSCETGYKPDKGICVACGVQNCNRYSAGCTCSNCNSGYTLAQNAAACCKNKTGCSAYNNKCICIACEKKFDLQADGTCKACGGSQYWNGSKCVDCSKTYSNCTKCDENNCKECKSNYHLNKSNECVNCSSRQVWDDTKKECVNCSKGCSKCTSKDRCTECEAGYELKSNKCEPCSSTQYYNSSQKKCVDCSSVYTNCAKCNSSNCTECKSEYHLDKNNKCIKCTTGYFDTTKKECTKCPDGCSSCTSTRCSGCNSPYHLKDGKCIKCTGSQYWDGSICKECSSKWTGCTSCTDSACTGCDTTKYELKDGKCVSKNCPEGQYKDGSDCKNCATHCKKCTNGTNCTECEDGYEPADNVSWESGCVIKKPACSQCNKWCKDNGHRGELNNYCANDQRMYCYCKDYSGINCRINGSTACSFTTCSSCNSWCKSNWGVSGTADCDTTFAGGGNWHVCNCNINGSSYFKTRCSGSCTSNDNNNNNTGNGSSCDCSNSSCCRGSCIDYYGTVHSSAQGWEIYFSGTCRAKRWTGSGWDTDYTCKTCGQ